jgi:hypothetical protein
VAPAPAVAPNAPAYYGSGSGYLADIANVGIVAPASWTLQTGSSLCASWASGQTTVQTDLTLSAGGILPQHLGLFDQITQADLCPSTPN